MVSILQDVNMIDGSEAVELGLKFQSIIDPKCDPDFFEFTLKQEINAVTSMNFDEDLDLLAIAKLLKQDFPYVSKLIVIGASVWVSTSTAERSFSKLNLIKNYLRTKMKQERLSSIAIVSMNGDVSVETDKIIESFIKENRKVDFS